MKWGMNMKILIMTGKFGMGHYSAAQSLAKQVKKVNPQAEVAIRDLFESVSYTHLDVYKRQV